MDHKTHLDPVQPGPPVRPPAEAPGDPRLLGGYRLLRRLGEGGMGAVYLGYHEGHDVRVALKVLNDALAVTQGFVDRFYREAKSGALLNHPNVVRTLAAGQDQASGKHYLVLEFVDGQSAHDLLDRQGRLAVGDAVHVALDIARALEHAHSRNVVHRDIKPDNILLTRSGVAKLADLGLAKRLDEASHLTATRQGFGTTPYMPYEQAMNARRADGRSDVYALGATLYHLVTGVLPFPADNHLDVVEKKREGTFTPASALNPAVPPALDRILERMMARDPRDRYQTASELIVDLERSRLAAPVPSFADPEQALQDPWVRACLASSAEPTRADLEVPRRPTPAEPPPPEMWVLRFRNKAGRVCKARATAPKIRQWLKDGRLAATVEARRRPEDPFQPLAAYAEFQDVARRKRPAPAAAKKSPAAATPVPAAAATLPAAGRRRWLLAAGAALLVAAVAALVWALL